MVALGYFQRKLNSRTPRELHRYRRDHGLESRSRLDFFQVFYQLLR